MIDRLKVLKLLIVDSLAAMGQGAYADVTDNLIDAEKALAEIIEETHAA